MELILGVSQTPSNTILTHELSNSSQTCCQDCGLALPVAALFLCYVLSCWPLLNVPYSSPAPLTLSIGSVRLFVANPDTCMYSNTLVGTTASWDFNNSLILALKATRSLCMMLFLQQQLGHGGKEALSCWAHPKLTGQRLLVHKIYSKE